MNTKHLLWLALLATAVFASVGSNAQPSPAFPTKPIKILVGVTPGGTTDTLARFLAQEMSKELGQPVIVDNRAGAGGNIAAEAVAKSPADGYTLLFCNTSHSVNPGLYGARLPFDALADFTPITQVSTGPAVLVASNNFAGKTAKDVIAMAKTSPGKLNFAVGGYGTSIHMAGELFKNMAGIDVVNVPYKGSSPALTDVMAGQIELMFAPVINAVPQIKAGKVKALGVTSNTPVPALPDVPVISASLPGYESAPILACLVRQNCPPTCSPNYTWPRHVPRNRKNSKNVLHRTVHASSAEPRPNLRRSWPPILKNGKRWSKPPAPNPNKLTQLPFFAPDPVIGVSRSAFQTVFVVD